MGEGTENGSKTERRAKKKRKRAQPGATPRRPIEKQTVRRTQLSHCWARTRLAGLPSEDAEAAPQRLLSAYQFLRSRFPNPRAHFGGGASITQRSASGGNSAATQQTRSSTKQERKSRARLEGRNASTARSGRIQAREGSSNTDSAARPSTRWSRARPQKKKQGEGRLSLLPLRAGAATTHHKRRSLSFPPSAIQVTAASRKTKH